MMHLFHTVGIRRSFLKKKNCVTQYFVNCGVPIFWLDFTPLWPIVLHCINFAVARYKKNKNIISKMNSVSCCFFGTRGNN